MAVADVRAHQLAVEVEEALPLGRPEVDALGAGHRDRVDLGLRGPFEQGVALGEGDHLVAGHAAPLGLDRHGWCGPPVSLLGSGDYTTGGNRGGRRDPVPRPSDVRGARLRPSSGFRGAAKDRVGGAVGIGLGGRPVAHADAHRCDALPRRPAHPGGAVGLNAFDDLTRVASSSPKRTSTWLRTTSLSTSTPSASRSRSAMRAASAQQRSTSARMPSRPSERMAAYSANPRARRELSSTNSQFSRCELRIR